MSRVLVLVLTVIAAAPPSAQDPPVTRLPLVRAIDLDIGESATVTLADKSVAKVKLLDIQEQRDTIRNAVREAVVKVDVDGAVVTLVSGNYRLPHKTAAAQIDCPITKGYLANATEDVWGLAKDARLRLWPAESSLMEPATFRYPARQRWFASATQMANEPVFVDGGEQPLTKKIYYHWGLDMGGAEEMIDVVAATDGLVVSSGKDVLPGFGDSPAKPRYDVVYIVDERGWYYRYSHLFTIAKEITPGARVKIGQKIGVLGKEGGSGGWSHLHFDITSKQPSGKWGIQEGYAFLWEAYVRDHQPVLIAVARPHHVCWTGETVVLDGSRSWSRAGRPLVYGWEFSDGSKGKGSKAARQYAKPGCYSEVLRVVDDAGSIDYDFAVVQVLNKDTPKDLPPSIHAVYAPTFDIQPLDPVTFKVRTFRTTQGHELWDFGDGSPKVKVRSDGNVKPLAKDGYAVTTHRYQKAGHYIVRVERTNDRGETATAHLQVRVGVK
jgi:murein DD-endopeptidase MepM/ murein hydrolase activator NlpD